MRFKFIGKNITIWDSIKEKVELKIGKLEKLMPADEVVTVSASHTKGDNKLEITVPLYRRTLRAEAVDADMFTAVDLVADKLERQLIKYKGRLKDKAKKGADFAAELKAVAGEEVEADDTAKISKIKRFTIKPMDPEEAVMEMELLGHSFYMFINDATNDTCLVYKRNDGTYGLIEPQK